MEDAIQGLITMLAAKFPVMLTIFSVVGVLRAVFKPIMTAIEAGVKASGSQSAQATLDEVEASKLYKAVAWVLDYVASIKVGPQAPK